MVSMIFGEEMPNNFARSLRADFCMCHLSLFKSLCETGLAYKNLATNFSKNAMRYQKINVNLVNLYKNIWL